MNDQMTSASGASLIPDSTSIITGTHLVVMAIFAVLAILGILWGARLKHRRRQADRDIAQDNRDIGTTDRDPRGGDAVTAAPHPPIAAPPPPAAPPLADAIPLTRLKGLGPKVAARFAELGIADATQLAALSDDEATALDAQLGVFAGRLARDRWVEQARLLAAGDTAGFEAAFGKL